MDVFVIDDPTPFGLSLLKPFDKLRANGGEAAQGERRQGVCRVL